MLKSRFILPTLLAGLALALGTAAYQVWSRLDSGDVAIAADVQPQVPNAASLHLQATPPAEGHDCDSQDHAAMMQDPDHHQGMMGTGEGDSSTPDDAGHGSMMEEHHGNSEDAEPDGMMGGGT